MVTIAETQCSWFKSACSSLIDPSFNDLHKIVGKVLIHAIDSSAFHEKNHFAQLITGDKDGKPVFRKYDHGSDFENLKHYDHTTPPEWN